MLLKAMLRVIMLLSFSGVQQWLGSFQKERKLRMDEKSTYLTLSFSTAE
jgi:hypothetical protein